jgi:serine protease AprX
MQDKHTPLQVLIILIFALSLMSPVTLPAAVATAKTQPLLAQIATQTPDKPVSVIVQKTSEFSQAETLVSQLGGKITRDLAIIHAFSAEMSAGAARQLAASPSVRWVSLDAPMISTGIADSTLMDTFTNSSFNGNDGNIKWSGPWQEVGETDGPAAGNVRVANLLVCTGSTGYCLVIYSNNGAEIENRGASRQADLSHAASATLSFSYRRAFNSGMTGSVSVQVSGDGGATWTTLATYDLDNWDLFKVTQTFDISPYVAANTQVRFIGSGSANRNIAFDNIQIEYATPTDLANPPEFSTIRDEFATVSYSGNNGDQNWSTDWTESDASGGDASGGHIKVVSASKCASNTDSCLSVMARNLTDHVYRTVDLSGAASVQLTLYRNNQLIGWNNNDAVALEVSTDGNTWTTLRTWRDIPDDLGMQYESFDLTPYISSNTSIRFSVVMSAEGGSIYLDNIQIQSTRLLNTYNRAIGADRLWKEPPYLDGQGITVAVVDSGIANHPDLQVYGGGNSRITSSVDFTSDPPNTTDQYGHGTHVAGIIGGNGNETNDVRIGVAPGANLISVKVSNGEGSVNASDLIEGLQWIYNHKDEFNIKVVNISLNSSLAESYQVSALDAMVEMLWFNGIVVVVSAGNNGSSDGPVTLYPPANDPFVITVGAADDLGTANLSDDMLTNFSAYGTTEDGFAKPDLLAPGRNIISLLASNNCSMYDIHPGNRVEGDLFRMTGTSVAAPMVSGAVALLLQDEPGLNPDQVKYRLIATANKGWPGYDAARAGAGYLDAYAAIHSSSMSTANTGIPASQMLWTGTEAVAWDSVSWNSVSWNSVSWNSVSWNSVSWNSVSWISDYWEQ